jgi:dimethylglycine dehydrogenase
MQRYHMRWFAQNLPADGSIRVENLSARYCGLQIAGPAARQLLQMVVNDGDVGGNAFPFLSAREMAVGACPNAIVVRVSFTGELGYEIYMPAEYQRGVSEAITAAGRSLGLRLAGSRALLSLRVEKGFPSWGVDLSPDYSPYEPGLGRFVRLEKPDFIGKAAVARLAGQPPKERLATFVVDANGVDCFGGEAIYRNGELAGYVTSATYGHHVRESLALGYVKPQYFEDGAAFEVELLGKRRPALMSQRPRFDPEGRRMRA